ncbi:MFS transporter [Erythrobacteraceae bacterium E2-1 Yellow Sea]|nr:MFS transporter [Erythrobacteraceae bacterium E2-1 Yellow Sea]
MIDARHRFSRPSLKAGIYAAAIFGAHLGFMPLLILLLPRRVEAIGDPEPLMFLSILLLIGGLVASVAHFVAGYISDLWLSRHGNRRALIIWGLVALCFSYFHLAFAQTRMSLILGIVLFQMALNLAFSPMSALLVDYFSDATKGRVAGLMNAALPLSSAVVAAVALAIPTDSPSGFLLTAATFSILIVPLLVIWPFHKIIAARPEDAQHITAPILANRRDFLLAWTARFLIQISAAFVIGYLYIYITSDAAKAMAPREGSASELVGWLSAIATVAALMAALVSGRISDAIGKRRLPLAISALLTASGLWLMSLQADWIGFIVGYCAFHAGLTAFLSIDAALVAQLVSGHPRRGALLGLMNLTNTLPSVLVPALTIMAIDAATAASVLGFAFKTCSIGAILAGLAITNIKQIR